MFFDLVFWVYIERRKLKQDLAQGVQLSTERKIKIWKTIKIIKFQEGRDVISASDTKIWMKKIEKTIKYRRSRNPSSTKRIAGDGSMNWKWEYILRSWWGESLVLITFLMDAVHSI